MILEFGNNQNKPGRCRYFEMRINLGITGPKANLWVNATTLIDALRATKFVDELSLETILYSLKVESRGKSIQLKDFTGQLQRDKRLPLLECHNANPIRNHSTVYWSSHFKKIFKTAHTIDPSIKVYPISNFKDMERKNAGNTKFRMVPCLFQS
jgi:hypothetical protein